MVWTDREDPRSWSSTLELCESTKLTRVPALREGVRVQHHGASIERPWNPVARLRSYVERRRRSRFMQSLRDQLSDLPWLEEYEDDVDHFELVQAESAIRVPLAWSFRRYRSGTPEERERVVADLRRQLAAPPVPCDFERARGRLRIELCSRAAYEISRLSSVAARLPSQRLLTQPAPRLDVTLTRSLCDALSVRLYYSGSRIGWVPCTQDHLDAWGCTLDEAIQAASANALDLGMHLFPEGPDGLRTARLGSRAAAALWRAAEWLDPHAFRGDPVVMMLDGKQMLLADTGIARSVEAMVEIIGHFPLRDCLPVLALRRSRRGWVRYSPLDENYPQALRSLELEGELRAFEHQRLLLQALFDRARQSVRVVPAERSEEGWPQSVCRWTTPGELLLPVTDRVELPGTGGEPSRSLAWRDVMPKLADLVEWTSHYPARVRVRALPSREKLEAILAGRSFAIPKGDRSGGSALAEG